MGKKNCLHRQCVRSLPRMEELKRKELKELECPGLKLFAVRPGTGFFLLLH